MGKKKETQGLLDQKTRLIGIAAAGHSVGCTHFSIMLLNYLAGYRRRRAALMEWNSTGDLERLEKPAREWCGRVLPTGSWRQIILSMPVPGSLPWPWEPGTTIF